MRIVDEAGLLACAMYVDLNPVRAAMVEKPEQAVHTSAYDRVQGEQGREIDSAAFDLVPISTEEAGQAIRETPVEQLQQQRKAKQRSPTRRRVRRDGWLSPLSLAQDILSADPQVHGEGYRASDKGFLEMNWVDYWTLLRWTAKQTVDGVAVKVPQHVASLLTSRGIDASMWRDLVWNFKKYFGRSPCVGSSESMSADAERRGKHWHRGQRLAAGCFVSG